MSRETYRTLQVAMEEKMTRFEEVLKPRNIRQRNRIVDKFNNEVPSLGARPRTEEEEFKEKKKTR